jgi:hypothetical protein
MYRGTSNYLLRSLEGCGRLNTLLERNGHFAGIVKALAVGIII